jgi:hypothetical protein
MIHNKQNPLSNSPANVLSANEKLTSYVLIAANIIPLIGVLFYDWDVVNIMLLYWLENIIIGVINILRIAFLSNDASFKTGFKERVFNILFFTFHYGMFCAAHGTLLFELLDINVPGVDSLFSPIDFIVNGVAVFSFIFALIGIKTVFALFAFVLSHGFSLLSHFFMGSEKEQLSPRKIMGMPYKRIFALHIGLLIGVVLLEEFGSPVFLMAALVLAKIFVDVLYHRKEHRQ